MEKEIEILGQLFKALGKAKDIIGEDTVRDIKSRLSSGYLKSKMFDTMIKNHRPTLSHEELISRLNPPIPWVSRRERCLNNLIQALHNPLFELLRNPFKSKKKKAG